MDSYDQVGSYQHVDREFAWDYLRVGGEQDDSARQSLMDIHRWDSSTTAAKMDYAVHVLLRYKLLDVLSNVLGCEKHPLRKTQRKLNVELPNRVERVRFIPSFSKTGINFLSSCVGPYPTGLVVWRNSPLHSVKGAWRPQTPEIPSPPNNHLPPHLPRLLPLAPGNYKFSPVVSSVWYQLCVTLRTPTSTRS